MELKSMIRPALAMDLDQLFTMLNDLAHHEGLTDHFKLTKTRLEQELFGMNADWNCLVATDSLENVMGFCFYTYTSINRVYNPSPMIQIDDLYIAPNYRKAKIGHKLIHELAVIAQNNNISCFNVWCVKGNEQGQKFYQKLGGEKLDYIDVYVMEVSKLLDQAPAGI